MSRCPPCLPWLPCCSSPASPAFPPPQISPPCRGTAVSAGWTAPAWAAPAWAASTWTTRPGPGWTQFSTAGPSVSPGSTTPSGWLGWTGEAREEREGERVGDCDCSDADAAVLRNLLTMHAVIGSSSRDWWVSGSDLAVENTWLWFSGPPPVLPSFFYGGEPQPRGTEYNCMILSYNLNFYGMAQRCSDTLYPVCQYTL